MIFEIFFNGIVVRWYSSPGRLRIVRIQFSMKTEEIQVARMTL